MNFSVTIKDGIKGVNYSSFSIDMIIPRGYIAESMDHVRIRPGTPLDHVTNDGDSIFLKLDGAKMVRTEINKDILFKCIVIQDRKSVVEVKS